VAPGEFGHVAIHVLHTDLVEPAHVSPLEHRPERLDALGASVASDILAIRVVDALMLEEGQVAIGRRVIGVEPGNAHHAVLDEGLKRQERGVVDHARAHLVGPPILHAGDDALAIVVAIPRGLALLRVHVLELAADKGLVGLSSAEERRPLPFLCLADAVRQIPGRFLIDAEIAVQLHRRNALEARRHQIDRDGPGLVAERRALHDRPALEREHAPLRAVAAAVRHRRASAGRRSSSMRRESHRNEFGTSGMGANRSLVPDPRAEREAQIAVTARVSDMTVVTRRAGPELEDMAAYA